MIDDLIHSQSLKENKQQLSSFLPLMLAVSILSGAVSGAIGGFVGARYGAGGGAYEDVSLDTPVEKSGEEKQTIRVSEESATVDVVKKASASVANIVITKDLSDVYGRTGPNVFPFDDFFEFGFPFEFQFRQPSGGRELPRGKQQVGGGSGFVISSDGLLLTNKHVIADDDAEYTVVLNDGRELPGKVLAKDPVNDIAIIKINASKLKPLQLGDSNTIQIGQTVIAIGNTLGEYRNTVTRGVVSGINRVVQAADQTGSTEIIQEAIQTDAAINPGNSGGPLLDLSGRVIGINTAVNREGQSIGFSIPINVAKRAVESVKKYGRIIRPWLGVRYVMVDEEIKKRNNLTVDQGALVIGNGERKELAVIPGSPADKAGLREGDVIVSVNGVKIERGHALANEVIKFAPGDKVTLNVVTRGKEREVVIRLEEFKEPKDESREQEKEKKK